MAEAEALSACRAASHVDWKLPSSRSELRKHCTTALGWAAEECNGNAGRQYAPLCEADHLRTDSERARPSLRSRLRSRHSHLLQQADAGGCRRAQFPEVSPAPRFLEYQPRPSHPPSGGLRERLDGLDGDPATHSHLYVFCFYFVVMSKSKPPQMKQLVGACGRSKR